MDAETRDHIDRSIARAVERLEAHIDRRCDALDDEILSLKERLATADLRVRFFDRRTHDEISTVSGRIELLDHRLQALRRVLDSPRHYVGRAVRGALEERVQGW